MLRRFHLFLFISNKSNLFVAFFNIYVVFCLTFGKVVSIFFICGQFGFIRGIRGSVSLRNPFLSGCRPGSGIIIDNF